MKLIREITATREVRDLPTFVKELIDDALDNYEEGAVAVCPSLTNSRAYSVYKFMDIEEVGEYVRHVQPKLFFCLMPAEGQLDHLFIVFSASSEKILSLGVGGKGEEIHGIMERLMEQPGWENDLDEACAFAASSVEAALYKNRKFTIH